MRIIGPGRAGSAFAAALSSAGWEIAGLLGRGDDTSGAAEGVDALVLATPDGAIAGLAASVRGVPSTAVLHMSGALGPDVLAPHERRAVLHPLVPLPAGPTGAERLLSGATFGVAGDPIAATIAGVLGGRAVEIRDEVRATYHAAATVAANHVVATLGQVARLAEIAGLQLGDFLSLARAALDDVARQGPEAALTGPVARGDWGTVACHLASLPADEHAGYLGGVALALRLTRGG